MKLVIVVYGNIASGKSTVTRLLAQRLPGYKLVNLDKCRLDAFSRNLGNGPGHRDRLAQEMCLGQMTGRHLLYETTAVTQFYKRASRHLRSNQYEFVFVRLTCSPATSLARYYQRKQAGHLQAPFAYGSLQFDIHQAIDYFHTEQSRLKADLSFDTQSQPVDAIVQTICAYVTRYTDEK